MQPSSATPGWNYNQVNFERRSVGYTSGQNNSPPPQEKTLALVLRQKIQVKVARKFGGHRLVTCPKVAATTTAENWQWAVVGPHMGVK